MSQLPSLWDGKVGRARVAVGSTWSQEAMRFEAGMLSHSLLLDYDWSKTCGKFRGCVGYFRAPFPRVQPDRQRSLSSGHPWPLEKPWCWAIGGTR